MVYVSGTLSIDKGGRTVGEGDPLIQTRHVLESVKSVIQAAGGGLSDVVYNMIFLKDLDDYSAMNSVYEEYFRENPRQDGVSRPI